jgi:adenylylsulfate kinase
MIIWLTGQPGAGKTTIAKEIVNLQSSADWINIDGDDIRAIFDNKDYSEQGRRKNIELAQQIALFLHKKGRNVVVSLVSPYKDQRDDFKIKVGENIVEVYVHTTEIRGRENFHVQNYEPPTEWFVNVSTDNKTVQECAEQIISYLI